MKASISIDDVAKIIQDAICRQNPKFLHHDEHLLRMSMSNMRTYTKHSVVINNGTTIDCNDLAQIVCAEVGKMTKEMLKQR